MSASHSTPIPTSGPGAVVESFKGIIMAFMMALVFRAFVIEGFEIPTGSMAPTLRGQHTQWVGPQSGFDWAVGPWYYGPGRNPIPIQGSGFTADVAGVGPAQRTRPLTVHDPQVGQELTSNATPTRGGDRVFILKYLWPLYTPSRYDVVVFKNPRDPTQNYIKRLTGVGPEQLALVDGDVFSRPVSPGDKTPDSENTWALPGWKVRRKPESAQRAMWQNIFDSRYSPVNAVRDGRAWFHAPWVGAGNTAKSWQIEGRSEYRFDGPGDATLAWDSERRRIDDYYAYNEMPSGAYNGVYPVSDLRLSLGVRPDKEGLSWSGIIKARLHEFRADIVGTAVTLRMRADTPDAPWKELGKGQLAAPLPAGEVTNIDFWHADQRLALFVDDREVAHGEYDWSPAERIANATIGTLDEVFTSRENLLKDPSRYRKPQVSMDFSGGAFTLMRVALSRDIFYRPADYDVQNDPTPWSAVGPHSRAGKPGAATHPRTPLLLDDGEFFFCGDNSPQSLDARLWDVPNPWMARLEPKTGVVGRDSLIGRAFIVYWPGMKWRFGVIPVPDTGRVRQVR